MTNAYRQQLQELKEMVQFGPGVTFAELMKQFREMGDVLAESIPWVPFSPDGNIKCTIIPTHSSDGFELILVRVDKLVRFPDDGSMGFRLKGVKQHIKAIQGTMLVHFKGFTASVTQDKPITIEPGELISYTYSKGLFLFKQMPRVADAEDFTFEVL